MLHVVWKTLAAHALHNRNQKLEAGDGPIPFFPRLIHPILAGVERHDLIERLGLAAGGFNRVAKIVVVNDTGGVIEQLANAYMMALQWETPNNMPFPMPIDVEINGKIQRVEMPKGRASFPFTGSPPVVDPKGWVLKAQ